MLVTFQQLKKMILLLVASFEVESLVEVFLPFNHARKR